MDESSGPSAPLAGTAKRFVHRLLAIGENRFQLLVVEVQEERNRLVDMVLMAVAAAALGLLALLAWSAALVIFFWQASHTLVLLVMGAVYGAIGLALCRRLIVLRRHQQTLSATLDQLRKDRSCLEKS